VFKLQLWPQLKEKRSLRTVVLADLFWGLRFGWC